jgi:hypothetical protein
MEVRGLKHLILQRKARERNVFNYLKRERVKRGPPTHGDDVEQSHTPSSTIRDSQVQVQCLSTSQPRKSLSARQTVIHPSSYFSRTVV